MVENRVERNTNVHVRLVCPHGWPGSFAPSTDAMMNAFLRKHNTTFLASGVYLMLFLFALFVSLGWI